MLASRLIGYHEIDDVIKIAITLAAPLEAPPLIFDQCTDEFYRNRKSDWFFKSIHNTDTRKVLISFGSGPRDVIVPSSLTSFKHSFINALVCKLLFTSFYLIINISTTPLRASRKLVYQSERRSQW